MGGRNREGGEGEIYGPEGIEIRTEGRRERDHSKKDTKYETII